MHFLLLFGRPAAPPAWIFDDPAVGVVDEQPYYVAVGSPQYAVIVQEDVAAMATVMTTDLSPTGSVVDPGQIFSQIGVGNPVGTSDDPGHEVGVVTEIPGYYGKVH
jgi:hypothetical protein